MAASLPARGSGGSGEDAWPKATPACRCGAGSCRRLETEARAHRQRLRPAVEGPAREARGGVVAIHRTLDQLDAHEGALADLVVEAEADVHPVGVDIDVARAFDRRGVRIADQPVDQRLPEGIAKAALQIEVALRSEEHTSELQSREKLVCL